MITKITKENANIYSALFAEAVNILTTHDSGGKPITESGNPPVIATDYKYEQVNITTEEQFLQGVHYIKVGETYELATLYDSLQTYYLRIEYHDTITTLEEYFAHLEELSYANKKFTVLPKGNEEEFFYVDTNSRVINIPNAFKTNGVAIRGDEMAEILYFKVDRFFDATDLATTAACIEWRTPAGPDGKRLEGISKPWIQSIDVLSEDYIVIGWALSSDLTKYVGTIDFALRFYIIDETNLEQPKFLYSLSTLPVSVVVKEGLNYDIINLEPDALDPEDLILTRLANSVIVSGDGPIPAAPQFLENDQTIEAVKVVKDDNKFKLYLTNTEDGTNTSGKVRVQAIVEDTGNISYTWFFGKSIPEAQEIVFEPTDDSAFIPNKIYYKRNEDKLGYIPAILDEGTWEEEKKNLYERYSVLTIKEKDIGSYYVRATNRLNKRTVATKGIELELPQPSVPEFISNLPKNGILDNNNYVLYVEAAMDEHAYNTYTYFKDGSSIETTESNFKTITEEGIYYIIAKSQLNGIEVESEPSESIRITQAPQAPVIISLSEPTGALGNYLPNKDIEIVFNLLDNNRTLDDKIECKLYKYNHEGVTNEEMETDINNALLGIYEPKPNSDILIENAPISIQNDKIIVKVPDDETDNGGFYFCQIINTYNGNEATASTKIFQVVDVD